MYRLKNTLLTACILFLCAWSDKTPDLSKLRGFDADNKVKWGVNPPFLIKYQNEQSSLFYLAALHTTEPSSNTFYFIKEALHMQEPQVIILEGFEQSLGFSPIEYVQAAENYCFIRKSEDCNEIFYAMALANTNKVKFIGGEPDFKEVMRLLKNLGYTELDVVGYYFTADIAGLYERDAVKTLEDLPKEFSRFQIFDRVLSDKITYAQYYQWLEKNFGRPITLDNLVDRSYTTLPDKYGNYLQKISNAAVHIRDKSIINTIYAMTKQFERVLVVYGNGHYLTQRDVLEDMYGKGKLLQMKCSLVDD